jgi:serine/threonine protein phosphatase PrpC
MQVQKKGGITCHTVARHTQTEVWEHSWMKKEDRLDEMVFTQRKQIGTFHDETLTSFFRRLAFSPDGNLLFASAGLVKDLETQTVKQTLFVYARHQQWTK